MLACSREETFDPSDNRCVFGTTWGADAAAAVDTMVGEIRDSDPYITALSLLTQREVRAIMAKVK